MPSQLETLPTLTVIVPAYNEGASLEASIERLSAVDAVTEIIIVDDGSSDRTAEIAEELAKAASPPGRVKVRRLPENEGKGAAVRAGIDQATGEFTCIHDADLEYDPRDLARMLAHVTEKGLDVLYGSRRAKKGHVRGAVPFYVGGVLMTVATNAIYGCALSDEPTCYKMIRTDLLRRLDVRANGFEFCPEVTGKLLRAGYDIPEVPISYEPRSIAEGKKIRAKDAIVGLIELLKWRFRRPVTK